MDCTKSLIYAIWVSMAEIYYSLESLLTLNSCISLRIYSLATYLSACDIDCSFK